MFNLFKKNSKKIKTGDIVVVKKSFLNKFPNLSLNSILTVEKVENEKAVVVFMNDKGTQVFRETLPVEVIVKTGE